MDQENQEKYNAMVEKINSMDENHLNDLVENNKCPYGPEHLIGVPMGMFHCPICGDMLVAGIKHTREEPVT